MPKVFLSKRDKDADMLRRNLNLMQGSRSDLAMSNIIGAKAAQTWRSRVQDPYKLTLLEVVKLCEKNHVDPAAFLTKPLGIG